MDSRKICDSLATAKPCVTASQFSGAFANVAEPIGCVVGCVLGSACCCVDCLIRLENDNKPATRASVREEIRRERQRRTICGDAGEMGRYGYDCGAGSVRLLSKLVGGILGFGVGLFCAPCVSSTNTDQYSYAPVPQIMK